MYEQCDIVAALDYLAGSKADRVTLDKLLCEGLRDCRRRGGFRGGVKRVGTGTAVELRVEGLLSSRSTSRVGARLGTGHDGGRKRSGAGYDGPELAPREDGDSIIESNGSPLPT